MIVGADGMSTCFDADGGLGQGRQVRAIAEDDRQITVLWHRGGALLDIGAHDVEVMRRCDIVGSVRGDDAGRLPDPEQECCGNEFHGVGTLGCPCA